MAIESLRKLPVFYKTTISGTTTSSGALQMPFTDESKYAVVYARCLTGLQYYAFPRGDAYFTCYHTVGTSIEIASNTELTFEVVYMEISGIN